MVGKEFWWWLKLGVPVLLLSFLASCLGNDGPPGTETPSSDVLRLAGGSDDAGRAWHAAGVLNPVFYHLSSKAPAPAGGFTHLLAPLTYLASRSAPWPPDDVSQFTAHVPAAFAACGIRLQSARIVLGDFRLGAIGDEIFTGKQALAAQKLIAKSPAANGLTLFFVSKISGGRRDAAIGGTAYSGGKVPLAALARQTSAGKSTKPEQIAAHEISHLLGLVHSPSLNADGKPNINFMHPRGCLKCAFTAAQCEQMKAHPMVSAVQNAPENPGPDQT